VSSTLPKCVVDTVVLLYFLLVDEGDLLLDIVGSPIGTPRIIFDPDEGDVPDAASSEMRRSITYHQHAATDPARDNTARDRAAANAKRLPAITELHQTGKIVVLDLMPAELEMFAKVTSPVQCGRYGLLFPLDPGEAACLAIAVNRNLTLATDDGDALRALRHVNPSHPYQRIRKLLIQAGEREMISKTRANAIHNDMTTLGFWDSRLPFPEKP